MNPTNQSASSVVMDILKMSTGFLICLILFFVVLSAYLKLAGPLPFSVNSTTTQKSDAFNVTGTGKAKVAVDQATVRLGVTAQGQTAEATKEQMNQAINKVSAGIKQLGVPATDIKTENININPTYDYSTNGKQTINGYTGNVNLVIKVKDTDLAGKIIDTATENGANQIGNISTDSIDTTGAEDEARQKAIDDAKKKAQTAAAAAGFRLGKLINYNEGNSGGPITPMYDKMALSTGNVERAPTQIEAGQNEVVVTVTLSYEII